MHQNLSDVPPPEPDSAAEDQAPQSSKTGGSPSRASQGTRSPVVDAVGANGEYISGLYDRYLADPSSLDQEWQAFFAGFTLGSGGSAPSSAYPGQPAQPGVPMVAPIETGYGDLEVPAPVGIYDLV